MSASLRTRIYCNSRIIQLAPKALSEVTPLGKSPVITDGDVVLAESTAIIGNSSAPDARILCQYFEEYLIEKYSVDGKLQAPSSGPGYVNNLYCKCCHEITADGLQLVPSHTFRGVFLDAASRPAAYFHKLPTVYVR